MFYSIRGDVVHMEPHLAVVEAGGVGYACHTSAMTLQSLRVGETAKLFTTLYLREGIADLYGFYTQEERNAFLMLIGVSGVGPKAAVSILSANTPAHFALAVLADDEKALTAAAGVGKKLAQRIVLELKDKLGRAQGEQGVKDLPESLVSGADPTQEARAALMVLGYSASEASGALRQIPTQGMVAEDIIRAALRQLSSLS